MCNVQCQILKVSICAMFFPLCNKDGIKKLLTFERVNLTCLFFFQVPKYVKCYNFCIERYSVFCIHL